MAHSRSRYSGAGRAMKQRQNRKQAKRKQKFELGTGWLKPVLAVLTVAGSAIGLTMMVDWMQDPRQWPVNQVRIEGTFRHLQPELLQTRVGPLAADGFFVMDVSGIQQSLQNMAWVDQVSVRRVWPDRLEIRVLEQQAVAHWGNDSYMNARADVFTPEAAIELPGLPWLNGPDGHQQRVLDMRREMSSLVRPLKLDVARLSLDARRTWSVELSNGLRLEVGRNKPAERLARFVRVYPAILAAGNGRLTLVDLRYGHGFAVHWDNSEKAAKGAG
jgi:cell division protein FtsQ